MKKGTKVTLFAAAVTGAALAGARLARLVRLQNEELNDMIGQQPGYTPAPKEEPVQAPKAEQPEQTEPAEREEQAEQTEQTEQAEQDEQPEEEAQEEELDFSAPDLVMSDPDLDDDWEEELEDDDSAIDPDEPL